MHGSAYLILVNTLVSNETPLRGALLIPVRSPFGLLVGRKAGSLSTSGRTAE